MLVRIKFVNSSYTKNKIDKEELSRLNDFLGEEIKVKQMKIGEGGNPEPLEWRDTFDPAKVESDKTYTLVIPCDSYEIEDTNTYIVDLERFTVEFPTLEVSIKGVPKGISNDNKSLIEEMNRIAEKIEDAKNRFEKVVEFNQKCEVHVPNFGLLNVNKLAFATNYCTEELQRLMYQGWRILAVCPQPNQRRPDYILGMHVSDLDGDVEVRHFSGNGEEGI